MTAFLFLRITHDLLQLRERKRRSGDTRRAAHSSRDRDPGAGSLPLAWVCPTAIPRLRATSPLAACAAFERVAVTIDVHGSLDRVKDVSSFGWTLIGRYSKSAGAWRTPTTFPSSFFQRTPVVAGAVACVGASPTQTGRTGQDSRCSGSPRRLTASRESGCLSPLRLEPVGGLLLLDARIGPSAHAAHTLSPWLGKTCL